MEVPLRRRENIVYNEHDNLFLGNLTYKISFDDPYNDFLMILHIANLVKELMIKNIHSRKREIYYTDVELFNKSQNFSNKAIESLVVLLGTRRKCLNIVAHPKSFCLGRLQIRDSGEILDLYKLGKCGWSITPFLDKVEILQSDAEFILVLENDYPLLEEKKIDVLEKIPCIIITGRGVPDIATREFLKKLVTELKIPVYGLCGTDPYAIEIMLTYSLGSVATAHETPWLAVNNFYWLGMYPEEVKSLPIRHKFNASQADFEKAKDMLSRPYIQKRQDLLFQIEQFLEIKKKINLRYLLKSKDLFDNYILEKIQNGNLIKI